MMKKLILFTGILFISTLSANAQWWSSTKKVSGNGELTKQTRNLGDYDEIAVTGMMEVELVKGREGRVEIEAESNLMEYIKTEIENGKLKISVEKGFSLQPSRNHPIKLTVPVETIDAVSLTGSGDLYSSFLLKAKSLRAELTGSGDIKLHVESGEIGSAITGSGNLTLRGKAGHLRSKITGSGNLKAYELMAETAEASVSGSGDTELHVQKELKARITGSGDITYKGNPEKEDFKSTGSGSVSKR